ncbi:helix-turn-helix domain-containing protein [uncultured Deinococcus sp.]|uniref:helix-turn-helix domain-containing protein n=1 Tax=Deinococcus yunweiensis TaxID=367282 RepID=UPI0025DD25AD|nr:helix-turn-helix transcriptional regulator [uncultured Deinococcus sp.]
MAHSPNPPSALRIVFGQRLREERRARNLTLEDVAERSGLNWSYIAQIERGERNIGIDNIDALSRAIGVEAHLMLQ